MQVTDPVRAACAALVRGRAVQFGVGPALPGAASLPAHGDGFQAFPDGGVDTVVGVRAFDGDGDVVATLREVRRVLRDGGRFVAVLDGAGREGPNEAGLRSLLDLVGGFLPGSAVAVDGALLVVAQRCAVAEARMPLAAIGPDLARRAAVDDRVRAELCFQLATISLQAGESELARHAFQTLLALEPSNKEALFGLGMSYGVQNRWAEARGELQRAAALDPGNPQILEWLRLARRHTDVGEPATTHG